MVHETIWISHIPYVKYLRIFGSLCHKHVWDQIRMKLEDKSEFMVLLSRHTACSWKLYNSPTQRIVASWDFTIKEQEWWNLQSQYVESYWSVTFCFHDGQMEPHLPNRGIIQVRQVRFERIIFPTKSLQEYDVNIDLMITPYLIYWCWTSQLCKSNYPCVDYSNGWRN